MHKWFKFLAAGLVLLGVLLAGAAWMLSPPAPSAAAPAQAAVAPVQPQQRIWVASRDLPAGQVLAASDVRVQAVEQPPAGALPESAPVLGRGTAQPLAAGQPVVVGSLLSGMAGLLQQGERAVAIKVDESSAVGHKLQPGDWVDVFVVLRRDGQEVGDTQARLLLSRKRVLAYGAQVEAAHPGPVAATASAEKTKPDSAADAGRNATPARTAVVAVAFDDVNRLLLAERQGQVLLALRSPLEPADAAAPMADGREPVALTLAQLSDKPAAPVPLTHRTPPAPAPARAAAVKPPSTGVAVEFIRGARADTVHY